MRTSWTLLATVFAARAALLPAALAMLPAPVYSKGGDGTMMALDVPLRSARLTSPIRCYVPHFRGETTVLDVPLRVLRAMGDECARCAAA